MGWMPTSLRLYDDMAFFDKFRSYEGRFRGTRLLRYAFAEGIRKRHIFNGYRHGRLNPSKGEDACDATV